MNFAPLEQCSLHVLQRWRHNTLNAQLRNSHCVPFINFFDRPPLGEQ